MKTASDIITGIVLFISGIALAFWLPEYLQETEPKPKQVIIENCKCIHEGGDRSKYDSAVLSIDTFGVYPFQDAINNDLQIMSADSAYRFIESELNKIKNQKNARAKQ